MTPAAAVRAAGPDVRRFVAAVLPTGAAAGLQLLTFVLMGRAFGPELLGPVAATSAVAAVAVDVAGLGGDAAMVRRVAVDRGAFPAAWGHALVLLALSLPPAMLVATAVAAVLAAPGLGLGTVALLAAGEVLAGRATAAAEIAFVASGRPVAASWVRLAAMAARAGVAVLVFAVFGVDDPAVWAGASAGQGVATGALLLWVAGRGAAPVLRIDRAAIGFGLLLMLNQAARSLVANLDRILLAALLAPAAFGLYAAAGRLQLLGGIANQAATRQLQPQFFRAAAAGRAALDRLVWRAAGTMALVGCLAAAGIALAAPVLPWLLGEAFAGVGGLAAGLGFAAPFVALQYPPADALTAVGRQGVRTRVHLGAAAGATLLLAAGAGAAGPWGAAAGFVAGQAGLAAALWAAWARARRA